MTDDERIEFFVKRARELLAAAGMTSEPTSTNVLLMRIVAIAMADLLAEEDRQRGFR